MSEYMDIRRRLVSEWLSGSGYQFADGPELAVVHWKVGGDNKKRYVEIWIPVEKAK